MARVSLLLLLCTGCYVDLSPLNSDGGIVAPDTARDADPIDSGDAADAPDVDTNPDVGMDAGDAGDAGDANDDASDGDVCVPTCDDDVSVVCEEEAAIKSWDSAGCEDMTRRRK